MEPRALRTESEIDRRKWKLPMVRESRIHRNIAQGSTEGIEITPERKPGFQEFEDFLRDRETGIRRTEDTDQRWIPELRIHDRDRMFGRKTEGSTADTEIEDLERMIECSGSDVWTWTEAPGESVTVGFCDSTEIESTGREMKISSIEVLCFFR